MLTKRRLQSFINFMFNINKVTLEKIAYLNNKQFFLRSKLKPIKDTDLSRGKTIER